MRSARRIESNKLQAQANQPLGSTRLDPLAGVWEGELVPLLQRSPALRPITLLEHLQHQKPYMVWISLQWPLQRRVRERKALHGPDPDHGRRPGLEVLRLRRIKGKRHIQIAATDQEKRNDRHTFWELQPEGLHKTLGGRAA